MAKTNSSSRLTGVAVPLGALYTKNNPVIGEYKDLIPFAQFCKNAGLKIIQLLPVNDTGTQSSPYSGLSAFALHPIYISLEDIPEFNKLYKSDKKFAQDYDNFVNANKYSNRYDYDEILNSKTYFLQQLYTQTELYKSNAIPKSIETFIKNNQDWIKTYAVYKKLKWDYMQASWKSWKKQDQQKDSKQILELWENAEHKKDHLFYVWCQYIAAEQFSKAVNEVHNLGILLKGDMPILMNEDSCDAWAYPQFFNQNLRAGSPADGDNPTGQNWGFPTYNWKNLKANDYSWWKNRLKTASQYYDAYRLDHILGFFRIWAIPAADCNALNGHTEPYASFNRQDLYELGFDDDRIRWLSQPHIPTSVIEDITWNHEAAHNILSVFCDRIGNEELWLYKTTVKGSQQFWDTDLSKFCTPEAQIKIKKILVEYWSNRSLLEIAKNKFIPLWTYGNSTSWKSLNENEKASLTELFGIINTKNEKLWKKQAQDIFQNITTDIKMIPCGEDLGVGIECVPSTMKEFNILGLRVVRWCRAWSEQGQPYIPFEDYEPLSVTTTSVHDSSTIRQWWIDEQPELVNDKSKVKATDKTETAKEPEEFSPKIAQKLLMEGAKSASVWYINPLQDYLYMTKKYWLKTPEDERINVPGTVNKFNWTYRIPASIEDLLSDEKLIEKISKISTR